MPFFPFQVLYVISKLGLFGMLKLKTLTSYFSVTILTLNSVLFQVLHLLTLVYQNSFKSNAFAEISGPNKLSQKKIKLILV